MEKTSKELLKEFVNSQHFTSTTDIMNSIKKLFNEVLQTIMEAEFEEKLGYCNHLIWTHQPKQLYSDKKRYRNFAVTL